MKHLLLLLLFILSLQAGKSDFSVIIQKPFNAALFDITQNYDRTITAVGFSQDNASQVDTQRSYDNAFDYLSSVSSHVGSQMHILQVDTTSKILLSKIAKLNKFNEAVAVVKTPSNGYFIGGHTLDGYLLVLKLDSHGNIIFTKTFGTKNYNRMNNLILMSDGGLLAIGSSVTSRAQNDNIFETGLGNNDIFITRFSKNGTKLWSKKYGTRYDDRGIDAVEASDGSIVVVGTTSYKKNRDVSLLRITENGNRIWLKHYQEKANGDNTVLPKKIIKLKDNNFVLALTQYNQMRKEHIRLIKFDLYQNILQDKEIFTTYPSVINDIKEYSDGKLIAVGYVKDSFNTDGLAMILDSDFALLSQEHYGEENYDVFNAVTILHNSLAAVAGIHTNENSQETNMWITLLNRDASVVQVNSGNFDLYAGLCELFADEITMHKIVVHKDLSIDFLAPSLLFKRGEYKLTQEQKTFMQEFANKLIPFLYNHRKIIKTLEINGHTTSQWHTDSFSKRYLKNEKLSLNRSYETIYTLFNSQSLQLQKWLSTLLKGSGHSYKNRIIRNGREDKVFSRRVSIAIELKEEF